MALDVIKYCKNMKIWFSHSRLLIRIIQYLYAFLLSIKSASAQDLEGLNFSSGLGIKIIFHMKYKAMRNSTNVDLVSISTEAPECHVEK